MPAASHLALLRGINVGGKNKLPMSALVEMFIDGRLQGCADLYPEWKRHLQSIRERVCTRFGPNYNADRRTFRVSGARGHANRRTAPRGSRQ